jgi:type I restriction enzyme, S subunit
MKYGLTDQVIEEIISILENNPRVDEAVLFGSRAMGNYRPGSDIDLALKGKFLRYEDVLSISGKLSESSVPYKVDLVRYETISDPDLVEHIDRVGVAFYERWKKRKWGDLVTLEYGKALSDYWSDKDKFPVYGTNGQIGTTNNFLCPFPSVIVGRKGAYRGIHYSSTPFYVIDTAFYLKPKNFSEIDLKFAYYQLLTQDINSMDSGSAIPSTSRDDFYFLDIFLPPRLEQSIIASFLSSIDNKIDLLHRQNKTLEALAETVFRQWFVEEAEDTWENAIIENVAEINSETLSKSYPFNQIEYLDTGSIIRGEITEYQVFNLDDAPSRAQRIVREGDVVYSLIRPIQRHYGLLTNINENAIASTGFCVIRNKNFSKYFLYFLLTMDENVEYLDVIAEGSTSAYPSLKPSDIADFKFQKPPKEKIIRFDKFVSDLWHKVSANQIQIKSLTKIRDILLPKLITGEIRVDMNS